MASEQQAASDLLASDTRAVMGSVQGRRFVWEQLSRGGLHKISYAGDPYATAFNEGRRNAALSLYADLEIHCPELYLLMQQEATARAIAERQQRETKHDRSDPDGD